MAADVGPVLTVGIDLAASPTATSIAVVEWGVGRAVVREVLVDADDSDILTMLDTVGKAGIDCPLGWPDAFVAFVSAHQHGRVDLPLRGRERHWRRSLTMRVTDLVVKEETGLTPLSVSADRLGHVAIRCAGLLAKLAEQGHVVDRSSSGQIVEGSSTLQPRRPSAP